MELAGIVPGALQPYAMAEGINNCMLPPFEIKGMPTCQPCIKLPSTQPVLLASVTVSKTLLLVNLPVYFTYTLLDKPGVAPVPLLNTL